MKKNNKQTAFIINIWRSTTVFLYELELMGYFLSLCLDLTWSLHDFVVKTKVWQITDEKKWKKKKMGS